MQAERWSEFSGVAGRVLGGSISGASLISGMVLGFVLLAVDWMLVLGGGEQMVMPFSLTLLAFVLARFAINGLYGEWNGTVFSDAGGPWTLVGAVALRYLALTFIWYAPLALIGLKVAQPAAAGASMMSLPAMMSGVLVVGALNILLMTLKPPIFLIVSVSSGSFGEVFSSDTWRRLFAGRKEDLFAIYAIYSGALCIVTLLAMPLAMIALAVDYKLAILVGGLSFCLLFGVSVNLLGRLCGFFACGDLGLSEPEETVGPEPRPTVAPAPAPIAPATGPPTGGSPEPATAQASPPVETLAPTAQQAEPAAPVIEQATVAPATVPSPPAEATAQAEEKKLPPLMDAKQRVDTAIERFAQDPEGALSVLGDLREEFAPHPLVLQSLAICAYRVGRVEESVAAAQEALPLCFERGHSFLAAEIFREMRQHRSKLGLNREQLLTVGSTLLKMDDFATAAKAYSAVIGHDPGETRAIKGLLQVAESILHKKHKPDAAAKVYSYLLQHCSSSPLAEFMSNGLEEAERKMAHASTASS